MTDTVEHRTSGRLTGPRPRTLRLVLRYRTDDPFAVSLHFAGPARLGEGLVVEDGGAVDDGPHWTVARALLDTGSRQPAGLGDLRVRPLRDTTVRLDFHSPDGVAVFHLGGAELRGFLAATYRLVPPGTESDRIDWPDTAEEFAARRF
jgi:hypothetical protein